MGAADATVRPDMRPLILPALAAFAAAPICAALAESDGGAQAGRPMSAIILASDTQGAYTALGQGTVSCDNWVARRKGSDWSPLGAWILGYVTAYNQFNWKGANIAEKNNLEGLFGWMDGYCAAHPRSDLAAGAGQLLISLGAEYKGILLQDQFGP